MVGTPMKEKMLDVRILPKENVFKCQILGNPKGHTSPNHIGQIFATKQDHVATVEFIVETKNVCHIAMPWCLKELSSNANPISSRARNIIQHWG